MLKTSFIKIISKNKVCISSLYKFFSLLFVFSTLTTSTISKSWLFLTSFILYTQNKMLPNNGTLLNGFLRPKLLNKPSASCSFMNIYFLIPHTDHFNCIINLLFFFVVVVVVVAFVFFLCFFCFKNLRVSIFSFFLRFTQ